MAQLSTCTTCSGFLPPSGRRCPHCDAARGLSPTISGGVGGLASRRSPAGLLLKGAVMVASGSAFALTMMACYGSPCTPGPDEDNDGFDTEGFCTQLDCDDSDPGINPGVLEDEEGDGVDRNCDGVDGIADPFPAFDAGPDPEPDAGDAGQTCAEEEDVDFDRDGYRICDGDCDDENSRVNPGAEDTSVDGVDQDCDGFDFDGSAPPDAGPSDGGPASPDGGPASTDGGPAVSDAGPVAADAGL